MKSVKIRLNNGLIYCPFCDATNENKDDFIGHMDTHNKKITFHYYKFLNEENAEIEAEVLEL